MRHAVRAVIVRDNKLAIMHRNKFGKEYWTLPGGAVEIGDELVAALFREVAEELSVVIKEPQLVFTEDAGAPYGMQYVFLCEYVSGELALSPHSEEAAINKIGQNIYEPRWLSLQDLEAHPCVSKRLQAALVEAFRSGFPSQTLQI